jgi:hypothetical protein
MRVFFPLVPKLGLGTHLGAKLGFAYKCTAEGGGATQKNFSCFMGEPTAHEELS